MYPAKSQRALSDESSPAFCAGRKIGEGEVIEVTPRLSFVGVHLFAVWMEQQGGLDYVLVLLKQKIEVYKKEHPDEYFSLLHHREQTLLLG